MNLFLEEAQTTSMSCVFKNVLNCVLRRKVSSVRLQKNFNLRTFTLRSSRTNWGLKPAFIRPFWIHTGRGMCSKTFETEDVDESPNSDRWWMTLDEHSERRQSPENAFTKKRKMSGSSVLYDFKEKLISSTSWNWTSSDWEHFENSLLAERESLSRIWEAVCMSLLFHKGFVDSGVMLLDYIRLKGRSPNVATLTAFIGLCGKFGDNKLQSLVYKSYDELLKISNVFDSQSCKNLIEGLSGTDRWKEAIALLEMSKLTQAPTPGYYGPIAQAAFRNNDITTGLHILEVMGEKLFVPQRQTYLCFVEACSSDNNSLNFETFFEYLRRYSWFPPADVIRSLIATSKSGPRNGEWLFSWSKMDQRGVCKTCGHTSKEIDLSSEEFKELQENFLEKALIDKDVFLKTSPAEVQNFLDFLKETAPFDVVLDSLNIAFKRGANIPVKRKIEMVHGVVDYFWSRDKKVMLFGRKHMLSWSKRDMLAITRKAACFFADNISQDDPFLLYATLYSGQDTVFVSSDEMRDHKHLLGPKLGSVFKQWQRSRQIYYLGTDFKTQRPRFQMPKAHDTLAQKDSAGWHIPFENDQYRSSFQHPNAWLCVRHKEHYRG